MKRKIYSLLAVCSLVLTAQTARAQAELQVIHNCADPAASSVDVYVNGTLALNDFAFREATPFLPLPSATLLNVGVAPGNSTSVNDTLVNYQITLAAGQRYVAIAHGVLNPANFAVNPNGEATGFNLSITSNIQNMAMTPTNVDFIVKHGSTDAPAVDVSARNVATIVTNAKYGDVTSYISVPAADYILDVKPAGTNTIVASYTAALSTLGGGSAIVFASGFLDPSQNQNGEAFGLFAALANGTVVAFPQTSQARLQVIHNAADPAAASVDIYVNGTILLNDFDFRTATPFVNVPADVVLNIGVAPSTSTSANDTIVNIPVTLVNGQTYVAIANGVLTPASFAANPDGRPTGFQLLVEDNIRESAQTAGNVDFIALHGATDAPTVDVIARGVATLVDNAAYTDITNYITVPAADYLLDVTPGNANQTIVASYTAALSTLGGGSAVVFASGFLDPSQNQNGEAFGLFAALANGTVVAFPQTSQARLQVIHNAADPAASSVDIYVNGTILLNDFDFRTATPFVNVPADVVLNIGVAPSTSTSANDTIVNIPVTLVNGQTYVAIANGVLTPASFATNPDGRPTGFQLLLEDNIRESAQTAGNVEFIALHGATDAPGVDVIARGVATLVDNAKYTDITNYISVPAASYTLDVTPEANNTLILASYNAALTALANETAVVFASGFLDPLQNQNGEAFGLWVTLADGTTFPLPVVTSVNNMDQSNSFSVYPNPASDRINLTFSNSDQRQISIFNALGALVYSASVEQSNSIIDVKSLAKGIYTLKVNGNGNDAFSKIVIE